MRSRFFLAIFFMLVLTACQHQSRKRPDPLPQDPFIRVYFNHETASEYTEPYRHQTRVGDDLEQQIVDAIASAKSTIDVAVQELRLPKIAQALVERHQAGVKVRVILDNTYSRPWSEFAADEIGKLPQRERDRYNEFRQLVDQNRDGKLDADEINQRDALVILKTGKIPWIDDTADGSTGSGLMHHKFVIVDERTLIVTSANFSTSDIHGDFTHSNSIGNANNLLKINSPQLAALFTQEFHFMWGDGPGKLADSRFGVKKTFRSAQKIKLGNNTISVQFSPTSVAQTWNQSSNGWIGRNLSSATNSIDLALFVFSEQQLANILETNHQKGVEVRGVFEPQFAFRSYSETLDMMGVSLSDSCKNELDNHPWSDPIKIGISQLSKGDLLHHKFGVIDKKTVITGSHNWSKAANTNNDETLLVINNPLVAAHYQHEFERLYGNAQLGLPASIQKKVQAQKQCTPTVIEAQGSSRGEFKTDSYGKTSKIEKLAPAYQSIQKVNLNTASQAELEALPGVGSKLAQQIIQTRQQKPFTSREDLDQVPGVGDKLLEKLSDRVTW